MFLSVQESKDDNMNVSKIESGSATQKGKKIGTIAGFGARLAYVAKKEGKDIFVNAGKEAVEKGLSSKVGVAVKAGIVGAIAAGFALGGRLIGGAIGKLIDKHNAKKQNEVLLKDAVAKALKDAKTIKVNELDNI